MTTVTNHWTMVLSSLCPSYDMLISAMRNCPGIKIILTKKRNCWNLKLEEQWPDSVDIKYSTQKLDNTVEWCIKALETWENCHRISWDTWEFDTKKNAEKFITYYNIACPHQ